MAQMRREDRENLAGEESSEDARFRRYRELILVATGCGLILIVIGFGCHVVESVMK